MAVEIRTRETWSRGAETSFDIEAWEGGEKLFAPGATVTRDRAGFGQFAKDLRVTVSWASASSDKSIANAEAQLLVMEAALALAKKLKSNAAAWEVEKTML